MERQSRRRVILWIVIAVALIAAFAGGLFALENGMDGRSAGYDLDEEGEILYLNGAEYEITHNIESYLLIGTDDSGNQEAQGSDEYRGQMADFLLLYVMDKTDDTYGFLQIDRNTMVEVPEMDAQGNGDIETFEQICTAHWYGGNPRQGCENTQYCVERLLGEMEIDGYYSIHMSDVGILNHAVGGVDVTLEDDFSGSDPAMTKGSTLTLSDEQAEIYVRGRMTVGDGTNESRMQRQTVYMKNFKTKAKERIGQDASFINDLFASLEEDAVTDVPQNRISVIANQMYRGEDLGILHIEGETKLGTTLEDGEEHEEFYAEEASIAEAMSVLCGIDEDHIRMEDEE